MNDPIPPRPGECPPGTHDSVGEAFACGRCSAVVRRAQREEVRAEQAAAAKPAPIRSGYPTAAQVAAHATHAREGNPPVGYWLAEDGYLQAANAAMGLPRAYGPYTPVKIVPCAWPTVVRTREVVLEELQVAAHAAVAAIEGGEDVGAAVARLVPLSAELLEVTDG